MTEKELNWMIGGPQGSGVDTAANIFGKTCGYGGLYVYGRREYHSNIKGLHSYFHLRVSSSEVLANVNDVDLLAAFDAETVFRHIFEVSHGGGIIIDKYQEDIRLRDIPTLPGDFKSDFSKRLEKEGTGDSLNALLEDAGKKGVKVFRVPYKTLLEQVSDELGMEKLSRVIQMINTLAVGISFSLLNYNISIVEKAIQSFFAEKPNIIEMNLTAIKYAYDYVSKAFPEKLEYVLPEINVEEERIFLSGNQAIAIGKVLGGCRMQTYYPITPAADESIYIESHEVLETTIPGLNAGVVVIQTEDEIAAMNMASGAALTGVRASTSTSGPGFSLMVEGLSWAGNNEVPVVVTYYQRGAPSTGLPTRHGQDDLRFVIHAGHGEFPRIVLASGDIKECFYDAVTAFNYAEIFQLPVIHLIDKALANSSQTYPRFDARDVKILRGEVLEEAVSGSEGYKRFAFTETGVSPRILLGMRNGIHWYTGDEHDEFGHISEESNIRIKMMEKRMKKIETVDEIVPISERVNFFGDTGARNMIISWGSPKGAIIEALNRLSREDHRLGFLQVRMVHPFPSKYISRALENAEKIIDVEMNYSGQLGWILTEKTGIPIDFQILKYNGRPMTTTEVYNALKLILSDQAQKREVLTYGS